MNLLVTGGAGFIGANFVRRRRRSHPTERLVVLDALTYAGNLASLADVAGFTFVEGTSATPRSWRRRCATTPSTRSSTSRPRATSIARSSDRARSCAPTCMGTATLLEKARAAGVKRFVHVSTDEVYGDLGPDDAPFTEETPIRPRSPYSASKAGSDHLVRAWFETYKLPTLITRCSNNYGPYQFPEKLIPLMILNALSDKPLPVYGDGMNVRDWIHVDDHCAAVERVLEAGRDGEVYNVGGRAEKPNLEIVRSILKQLGKPESLIRYVTDRPGHDRRYAIDDAKIERELGWTRTRRFDEGLAVDHRLVSRATRPGGARSSRAST